MRNGIVIPCYNEASRLNLKAFDQFISSHPDYTICFVNDGSSDHTLDLLNEFQKDRKTSVLVYNLAQNSGKAEAVRQGIQFMIDSTPLNTIGFMDADLSTGFDDYKNLVRQLTTGNGTIEMTFGSRRALGAEQIDRSPFRKLMSMIIRVMIYGILRLPIQDTQCGAKVFTIKTARDCFSQGFISRWLFDVELFIRMKKLHSRQTVMHKLKEVPLKKWVDVEGSKITFNDSIQIPAQLLKIASGYMLAPRIGQTARVASAAFALFLQSISLS